MKRFALLAVCALLLGTPVRADIIVTTSGGTIVGKIIEEKENEVRIKTDKGPIITLSRDEIDTITKEKPEDTFARKWKAVRGDDVKGYMELAQWAKDQKLEKQATDCYEKVIKLEPDHPEAHIALGYERVAGKWLKGEELQKAKGLVEHDGRWVTPEEKKLNEQGWVKRGDRWVSKEEAECIDQGKPYNPYASSGGGGSGESTPKAEPVEKPSKPEKPEPAPRPVKPEPAPKPVKPAPAPKPEPAEPKAPPIELPSDDKELMKIVLSATQKPEARNEAVKTLAAKGDTQQSALKQELGKALEDAKKKVLDYVKSQKGPIRGKMAALVLERRKAALMFIFDKAKYPDEDHGRVGQPEVDRLVGELRRAWQDPLRELLLDKSEKKLADKIDELRRIAGWLRDPLAQSVDLARIEDDLAAEANKVAGISEIGADGQDAQMLDASKAVLKYNETTKTSLTAEERSCILVTNEYRMMFGLKALKVFEPLVQAARKHSQEMVAKNYFAHESPVPENATPGKRVAREGGKYTGENIAMGNTDGKATFHQWYTSSGHHRNMLMRHRSIGIGAEGNYWTEDFGADDPN